MKVIQGIGSSRGIACGPVFPFRRADLVIETFENRDPAAEWKRLESALAAAREQLAQIYQKALRDTDKDQAEIFQFHTMITEDADLLARVKARLDERRTNVEPVFVEMCKGYAAELAAMDNDYFAARAIDVLDVANRVTRLLLGVAESPSAGLRVPSIITADDLTPSDTILIDKNLVLGFCVAKGSVTSHAAILARGLGLPSVDGAGDAVLDITAGTMIILDGYTGTVTVDPDESLVAASRERAGRMKQMHDAAREHAFEPAITIDGKRPHILANIGDRAGAKMAVDQGAEGCGLLRTEFLYMGRSTLPTEEEQFKAYKAILQEFGDRPVVLRTLDIGGDKNLPYLSTEEEENPFLGVRGLRLSLRRTDIFKPQLRAALRAGTGHNLKIMFPMVSDIDEVRRARRVLEECKDELTREGIPFAENVDVGIMVETPAAALCADSLAREVDFFSIGTNDLSQYTMAADRGNPAVASLCDAFHPAVLRLIRDVIEASHRVGKWTGVCGELAGEPLAVPLFLGMGLDEFSMAPVLVPVVKALIRKLDTREMKGLADEALKLSTVDEVRGLVKARVPSAGVLEG
ncbi:phosphoenolpyruvate-protein phosphotransferase (plasmid) [Leptolinea sp. HRD-7]|nr:phosphoenolpyruvate-protein phosphotransferase [Leptolinea sp. HRD-7]